MIGILQNIGGGGGNSVGKEQSFLSPPPTTASPYTCNNKFQVQILRVSSYVKFRVEQQKPHHHPYRPTCDQVAKMYNLSAIKLQYLL